MIRVPGSRAGKPGSSGAKPGELFCAYQPQVGNPCNRMKLFSPGAVDRAKMPFKDVLEDMLEGQS